MELQGKVIAALPEKSGTSARGEWKVQEFVIETHDQYPRKMVFSVFGADRLQRFNISVGQEVSVSFDIDAHEYNGRWFDSIRAFDHKSDSPCRCRHTVHRRSGHSSSAEGRPIQRTCRRQQQRRRPSFLIARQQAIHNPYVMGHPHRLRYISIMDFLYPHVAALLAATD